MRISGFGEQDTGAWDALHKGTEREGVDSPSHFELSTLKTMLPHRRPSVPPPPPRPVPAPAPVGVPAAPAAEYYDDDGYEWVEDGESGYWEETGTASSYYGAEEYDAESYLTHVDRQVPQDSAYYQAPERRHLSAVDDPAPYEQQPYDPASYEQEPAAGHGYAQRPAAAYREVPPDGETDYFHPASPDAAYASGYQRLPEPDAARAPGRRSAAPEDYTTGYQQLPASNTARTSDRRPADYASGYHQQPVADAAYDSGRQRAAEPTRHLRAGAADAGHSGYHPLPGDEADYRRAAEESYPSGYDEPAGYRPGTDAGYPRAAAAEPGHSGYHQLPGDEADYRRAAEESYPSGYDEPTEYSSGYFEAPAGESTGRHSVVVPNRQAEQGGRRRAAVDTADRESRHRPAPAGGGYLPVPDAQHRLAEPPERTTGGRRRAPEPVAAQPEQYPYASEPVAAQEEYPAEPYSPEAEVEVDAAWAEPPSREDPAPTAKPAKSRVRPYARTRGRTRSDHNLALEALVSTSDDGRRYRGVRSIEHRRICDLCLDTRSVAEIAAHLHLPLGVVKILVGDMADIGLVLIHQTELVLGDRSSRDFMERVLQGLRNL
ncbi:DUF742 domain-containing protein [Amycolatopsis rhabdoformis]|uniref:DUF742 domain-containing protein n=1 Tax=Amycolatopsis rhabdoformis TaxID=1448059 RepID=UPI0038991525